MPLWIPCCMFPSPSLSTSVCPFLCKCVCGATDRDREPERGPSATQQGLRGSVTPHYWVSESDNRMTLSVSDWQEEDRSHWWGLDISRPCRCVPAARSSVWVGCCRDFPVNLDCVRSSRNSVQTVRELTSLPLCVQFISIWRGVTWRGHNRTQCRAASCFAFFVEKQRIPSSFCKDLCDSWFGVHSWLTSTKKNFSFKCQVCFALWPFCSVQFILSIHHTLSLLCTFPHTQMDRPACN